MGSSPPARPAPRTGTRAAAATIGRNPDNIFICTGLLHAGLPHLVSVPLDRPVVGLLQQRGPVTVVARLAVVAGLQDALVVVDGAGVHSSRGLNQVPGYITRASNESSRSSMFHNQASAMA